MAPPSSKYLSIRLTQLLMKIIGFWNVETEKEQRLLRINFAYMLFILFISLAIELQDLYHCRHDLYAATYTASSTIPLIVILIKVVTFTIHRKEVLWLIECAQENFWYKEYDDFGRRVLDKLDKKAILFMCSFTTLIYGTAIIYMLDPIIENVGKDEADRILPFTFRLFNLPTAMTPYYETLFVIEMFATLHSCLCFCCFDNFLCILSMHISGQFTILQHNLQTILARDISKEGTVSVHDELKHHVAYHRLLISFVQKLEGTFCYPIMGQLLISSIVLCISSFQLCLEQKSFMKQLLFVVYFLGGFIQIFLITFNCNNIIIQSNAIGDAVYSCNWENSSYKSHRKFRKNLLLIIMRSKRPCYLTAGKFFPVSLESFMKVLGSTVSYFTLLRELDINVEEE